MKFTNNKKKTTKEFKRREAKVNIFVDQAPVAQKVINPFHWLNHHPVNKYTVRNRLKISILYNKINLKISKIQIFTNIT